MFTEDFLTNIVNVQWGGGLYALVWVNGGTAPYGYYNNGAPKPSDVNGNFVPFDPSVTNLMKGASIVYQRVLTNTASFPSILYQGIYVTPQLATLRDIIDGTTPGTTPTLNQYQMSLPDVYLNLTTPMDFPPNQAGFFGKPYTRGGDTTAYSNLTGYPFLGIPASSDPWTGATAAAALAHANSVGGAPPGGTTSPGEVFLGSYREGPDDAPPTSMWPLHIVDQYVQYAIITAVNKKATFEAVFLIKLPTQTKKSTDIAFDVNIGPYISNIVVQVYPQKGITVDPQNTKAGFFNAPPNGRVYVPLKFTNGKLPPDPTKKPWPGYTPLIFSAPPKNVANAGIWDIEADLDAVSGGDRQYKFVATFEEHLFSDPAKNPMVANKIFQMYLAPSSAGVTTDGFYVLNYTDVAYGTLFNGNSFASRSTPGPFAKIASDVPA